MELTPQVLAQVSKSLNGVFSRALESKPKLYEQVALQVQAGTMTVEYRWLATLPSMREWTGERTLKNIEGYGYTITKKNWESTIKVDRDIIKYDSLGIVGAQVAGMADLIIDHYNAMVFGLFNTNSNCYDGVNFFHDQHPTGTNKHASNKGSHNLDQQGLLESRTAMMCYQNEDGR
uniref:Mu-like prophage major head subunit gpT family protein n=1 Tax=Helicobacter suis TaxID=104628 RepID=UPI0019685FFD